MLAVMLVAILLDRRAFSVRNVAVAATIILLLTPEALLSVSFQMSFAATLALIAGFEIVSERRRRRLAIGPAGERRISRTLLLWAGGLALTSILAGLATAPFAAFHFNRTAPLSLLANLAAMPVVSLIVMLMALLSVVLMPLGLESWPLTVMDQGLRYVLAVADKISDWTGNSGLVSSTPMATILLVALGLVWLCLWRQRWRMLGVPIMILGLAVAVVAPRPSMLIADDGSAFAIRGPHGVFRVVGNGSAFDVENWLDADADPRPPRDPSLDDGVSCDPWGCTALIVGTELRAALALEPAALMEDCRMAAILVTIHVAGEHCSALAIDRDALARGGAHAVYVAIGADGRPSFEVVTARPEIRRPWMPPLPVDQ